MTRIEVGFNPHGASEPWPHFVANVGEPAAVERLYELLEQGWQCTFEGGEAKGYEVVDVPLRDDALEDVLWQGAAALTEQPDAEALVRFGEDWRPWTEEGRADDPRRAGGQIFDAGDAHSKGTVMFDTRNAVLLEAIDTAVAHPTTNGRPSPDVGALQLKGRINRPPDGASAGHRAAETVTHLHLLSWEAAADLVTHFHSLAARAGSSAQFTTLLEARWEQLQREGLTSQASGAR